MDVTAAAQLRYDSALVNSQIAGKPAAGDNQVQGRYSDKELAEMKEACDDFEAIFIKMMLDSMKATVPESGLIKKNQGEEYFDDMLYQEYADSIAQTDSFGISDAMYRQMTAQNSGGLYN